MKNQKFESTIAVVGNPNSGKTSLFNALTGSQQSVGNWAGVTVEKKTGSFKFQGDKYELVDLPGIYALDVFVDGTSIDEQIAWEYVTSPDAGLLVNIVDASNLERNLYLTTQLLEMRRPMVVALNMMDVASGDGLSIDVAGLSERLGCPVIPIVAASGKGMERLLEAITQAVEPTPAPAVNYPQALSSLVNHFAALYQESAQSQLVDPHWLVLRLLEQDPLAAKLIGVDAAKAVADSAIELRTKLPEDLDIVMVDARYGFAHEVSRHVTSSSRRKRRELSQKIDRIVLNRWLGIPIFLAVMYLLFLLTINLGNAFVDFFDQLSGALLVDGLGGWLAGIGAPGWLVAILANGIGSGIQVVATFVPIVGLLYFLLSVLEDSGYMARAAFVVDRAMRTIGLPGKAFVPLLTGFGCNVPAILATRTLEQKRDRIITIVMAPFMSCGARLPVYALFAAAFFTSGGQNIVFALYLIGILAAVLTGLILKKTILRGSNATFILELPTWHRPRLQTVFPQTWARMKGFIIGAGKIIVPIVVVLNLLNTMGTDGSFNNADTEDSVLSTIGRTITPVFAPMGIAEDNWPAAVGIFTGVAAKEVVVGTLDALYSEMARQEASKSGEEAPFNLGDALIAAWLTIPANLGDLGKRFFDPLGLDIIDTDNTAEAAKVQDVDEGTFGAMQSRFDGKIGAFAYLLFILLYTPCAAAMTAVVREIGARWAVFVALWTLGFAYLAATVFYQAAIFNRQPAASASWLLGSAIFVSGVILVMYLLGNKQVRLIEESHISLEETG